MIILDLHQDRRRCGAHLHSTVRPSGQGVRKVLPAELQGLTVAVRTACQLDPSGLDLVRFAADGFRQIGQPPVTDGLEPGRTSSAQEEDGSCRLPICAIA